MGVIQPSERALTASADNDGKKFRQTLGGGDLVCGSLPPSAFLNKGMYATGPEAAV